VIIDIEQGSHQMASVDSLYHSMVCIDCQSTESSFWHKGNAGAVCTTCYCQREGLNRSTRRHGLSSANSSSASKAVDELCSSDNSTGVAVKCGPACITRKSSRLKPLTRNKLWQNVAKPSSTKGRSKRYIFKKNVSIYVILCKKTNRIYLLLPWCWYCVTDFWCCSQWIS